MKTKDQIRAQKYYILNKDIMDEKSRLYYQNNKSAIISYTKSYYQKNKERLKKYQRDRRIIQRQMVLSQDKERRQTDRRIESMRLYRLKNKEKLAQQNKQYRQLHKAYLARIDQGRFKKRFKEEPDFKLRCIARTSVGRIIKLGAKKKCKSLEYLGCSIEQARAHIEGLWLPGMTWNNHSRKGWHIDHIRPLASFDFSRPEQVMAALHYTNLQPLWAFDNHSKGDKYA